MQVVEIALPDLRWGEIKLPIEEMENNLYAGTPLFHQTQWYIIDLCHTIIYHMAYWY